VQDARVTEGTRGRIEEVYRADGQRLWRALLAWSGDREVTSDAVAEAYAQALRRGDELRNPSRWIWKAAFRIAAGELKARGRFSSAPMVEAAYEPGDLTGSLLMALRQLSPMQRGSLVLHHFAGYRAGECARILGSTSAAVRVHLMRGRRRLRELLEERDA
jgi:RNA polymerase sigma-70 factor (ECF subfamily)